MSRRFVIDPTKPFFIFDTAGDWLATKIGSYIFDGRGDYIGFARGTTASPKTTSSAADEITVGAPVTGVDFGLGVAP